MPHVLDLTYVENVHGAMGLFGSQPELLVALAVVVLALLGFALREPMRGSPLAQVGFGAIAGGATGNVIDRLVHGYVIDFLALPHFYVINLADASITGGLILIAVSSFGPARAPAAQ